MLREEVLGAWSNLKILTKLQIEDNKKLDKVSEENHKLSDFRFEVIQKLLGNVNPNTISNEQILHVIEETKKRAQR